MRIVYNFQRELTSDKWVISIYMKLCELNKLVMENRYSKNLNPFYEFVKVKMTKKREQRAGVLY